MGKRLFFVLSISDYRIIMLSMTVYDVQYGSENETGDFQEVLQWTNKEHG